eukprot:TCALIF_11190-PA protein Name:"Protein of unknown function" AED:0.32 eAED:0.32 QI:0/0/0/0.5/1/1/2/0/125
MINPISDFRDPLAPVSSHFLSMFKRPRAAVGTGRRMELGTDFSSPLPYYLNSTELEIVPERGIIALNYLNPYVGSPMVAEPVPPGINIFNIMNLTVADDVSRLEEWTILINPNSTKYAKLKSFFQ